MTTWLLIAALGLGTLALKVLGPVTAGGRTPPAPLTRVIALLTPALIGALVVSSTFTDSGAVVLDARVVGVGVGALALWFKAPLVVALVLGAAAAAAVRALT